MSGVRLDQRLVELGHFESREKARATIMSGLVYVNGQKADKPGLAVKEDAKIEVRGAACPYVSRGGFKLEKALRVFPISPEGKVCIDCGASTGGFTDVLLKNGAARVYAVDVGYGQLAWSLRSDPRVVTMERTNARSLTPEMFPEPMDMAVMDLSFISVRLVLPAVRELLRPGAPAVCLIKPQFEAGREDVGKKGVVRDSAVHERVLREFLDFAPGAGYSVRGLDFSPVRGHRIPGLPQERRVRSAHPGRGGGGRGVPQRAGEVMKKIVLSPNPYRDRGLVLTYRAKELLERDGRQTVVAPVFVEVPGDSNMVPLRRAVEDAEMIISFGGDGTFLHVARQTLGLPIPLLGVNVGTKGFMAGLEPEDLELVRRAASGGYRRSLRMMLDVELLKSDGEVLRDCALNDAVVKSDVNCINLTVLADGTEITGFAGDGVIVATPTGSTAYSMSAGGPIVEPEAENIIVTPICAHVMAAKSFVLAPERTVTVEPERLHGKRVVLSVDGSEGLPLSPGDEVRIRRSENTVIMADMEVRSFYDTAMGKLSRP